MSPQSTQRFRPLRRSLFLALLVLQGCAPMVPLAPAQFSPQANPSAAAELRLSAAADVPVVAGFRRVLPAGSRWLLIGRLPEGDVYRPAEGVFTIEGRQVHEARLVIAERRLVGFYLPAEGHYSPLSVPVPLSFGENPR